MRHGSRHPAVTTGAPTVRDRLAHRVPGPGRTSRFGRGCWRSRARSGGRADRKRIEGAAYLGRPALIACAGPETTGGPGAACTPSARAQRVVHALRAAGCPSGSTSRTKRSREALRAGAVAAWGSASFAHREWAAIRARMARCSGVTLGLLGYQVTFGDDHGLAVVGVFCSLANAVLTADRPGQRDGVHHGHARRPPRRRSGRPSVASASRPTSSGPTPAARRRATGAPSCGGTGAGARARYRR